MAAGPAEKSSLCQRLPQIFLQIVGVLDADAEADQSVIDAAGAADVGGDAGVRHARRMGHQRFDAAETLSETQ